jgi:hypothetical protein
VLKKVWVMRSEQLKSRERQSCRSKIRRLKLRRLKLRRLEMKTKTVKRLASALILIAVISTTVMVPVYASGIEVIPAGSVVVGRVTTVSRASRKSKAGTIGVHFVSLRLPTGITRAMNGDLTNVSEEVNADNEGEVGGHSATNRNVVFVGGGAAAGALIGAIAGGGKGAGIGAGVGAGLGVAGAWFSKGHEAVVKSGTEFGVILNQSLSLPKANVR